MLIDLAVGATRQIGLISGLRRRIRVGLIGGVALAAVVAGGVSYAALIQPGGTVATPHPGSSAQVLPSAVGRLAGRPGVDPVSRLSRPVSRLSRPVSRLSRPVSRLSRPVSRLSRPVSAGATGPRRRLSGL